MATIYNTDLSKEIQQAGKIQVSRDKIPTEFAEKVIAVAEVNPKLLKIVDICRDATATNAVVATIFTTPTDKDFYLTNAQLSIIKDVTSTSATSYIDCVINNVTTTLLSIPSFTLTVQNQTTSVNFRFPLKIDRGTSIRVLNGTNVANISAAGNIQGYLDYNIKA